jgi:hypothetical protein
VQLSALRTAVNTESGLALNSVALNLIINRAVKHVGNERDWWWLELVETGTWPDAEVSALDTEAKKVRSVVVADRRYDPMAEADADLGFRVTGYSIAGRNLRVVPTPAVDAAYTIWYVAYEPTLVADADEPLCPDGFIDAVIMKACSMVHDRPQGDKGARANFEERYRDARKLMLAAGRPSTGAQLPRVRQDVI